MKPRDYAWEALVEVTASDPGTARGQLNKALLQIREQSQEEDSYLLSVEIHERAKMYRALWPEVSLTPSALAKHWKRVFEETKGLRRPKYVNPPPLPKSRREENLKAAQELMSKLWGGREGEGNEMSGDRAGGSA